MLCIVSCGKSKNLNNNLIKKTAIKFLIKQGDLKPNKDIEVYFDMLILKELKEDKQDVGDGVFRLGIFKSHTNEYILFKNNSNITIFELDDLPICIENLFDYLEVKKINKINRAIYIREVIKLYQDNVISNRVLITPLLQE